MRIDQRKLLCGLIVLATCPAVSHATDMFGNPTAIGTPGQFEIQIGGGKSEELALDSGKTTGTLQIGTLSESKSLPAFTGTINEDQIFIRISYALNTRSQLFADLGSGKDSGQQSDSRAIGVNISPPVENAAVRMGLMLRAQQVTTDIDGPFTMPYPYNTVSDGVNNTYVTDSLNGTEQIKYTRLDAFFGASGTTGVFRPYGGLGLTRISGTDTMALDDTTTAWSYPVGGGTGTSSTQHVTFNAKSDISGGSYFSGVLGLSIIPDGNLGMTAELQIGVQRSLLMTGNIRF